MISTTSKQSSLWLQKHGCHQAWKALNSPKIAIYKIIEVILYNCSCVSPDLLANAWRHWDHGYIPMAYMGFMMTHEPFQPHDFIWFSRRFQAPRSISRLQGPGVSHAASAPSRVQRDPLEARRRKAEVTHPFLGIFELGKFIKHG